ncbi:abortive infection family protein [Pseudoalteromonas sp. DL-6]|uniref:abortive infection family protein n=1 Tax=Pseudoalteromonas sp. DL-6 TaxID=1390185 RepID=UPI00103993AB|nr:abortive infection family protein [Pseudoalteromonas sp. DL-6]QBJ63680.1 abortive phage resistance protein [Pseudoalteromonas sp. DL-6]
MPKLKGSEIRTIDKIFEMTDGYLLDFSDRTMAEYFEDELNIDITQEKYQINGGSKAKRLRAFIELEDGYLVGQVLRKLWQYKSQEKAKLLEILAKVETGVSASVLATLSTKAEVLNMDTVSRDLDRALKSAFRDPESAVTSACSTLESVCRSIIIELGFELPKKKDIKGLFDSVKRPLGLSPGEINVNPEIADDVRKVLSGLATIVEGIGALRTHGGDAHGRERGYTRLDARIAKLAIHSASTAALFLIETWQLKYPSKELVKH